MGMRWIVAAWCLIGVAWWGGVWDREMMRVGRGEGLRSESWGARRWRAPGVAAPVLLYPRHRILSAFPPLMVVAPGVEGAVEVRLRVGKRERIWRTQRRIHPWPQGWDALKKGQCGVAEVRCGGGFDRVAFERAPELPVDLRWRTGAVGVPWLMDAGLPMEAALLAVESGFQPGESSQALFRAGVPLLGLWRDH